MATIARWLAFGVCIVFSFAVHTSSAPLRDTDSRLRRTETHKHVDRVNEILEKLVDVMEYEIRELPSAEKADLDSALLEQHERDIAVPFPELTYAPSKKAIPWPAVPEASKKPKTPKVRTAGPRAYGGEDASPAEVPAAKKDLTVEELKRLLKILKKRDYDIPFPVSGDNVRKPQQ